MSGLTHEQIDAIAAPRQTDYDSVGSCVCGESYPCSTLALVAEVVRLTDGIRSIADRRCLCDGHSINRHGGPCCGVGGGRCVTCEARFLLDVAGDDALDEIVRVSEAAGLYDTKDDT